MHLVQLLDVKELVEATLGFHAETSPSRRWSPLSTSLHMSRSLYDAFRRASGVFLLNSVTLHERSFGVVP